MSKPKFKRREDLMLAPGRGHSYSSDECTGDFVLEEVKGALGALTLALLKEPEGAEVLPESKADFIRQAYTMLHELTRYLPKVEVWCVVKKRHGERAKSGSHNVSTVWLGCLSEGQARDFAEKMDKREADIWKRHSHWGPERDTFVAERAPCRIQDIVAADAWSEDYIRTLASW